MHIQMRDFGLPSFALEKQRTWVPQKRKLEKLQFIKGKAPHISSIFIFFAIN